jgi:creatinine amidohydrolase/Fe(II)-dependent formamide hydrolase-like protein
MSDTGVVTSGDPRKASAERGRRRVERFVEAAVQFIEEWKRVAAR